jgi:chemotaxis protein histidine kinase CheA
MSKVEMLPANMDLQKKIGGPIRNLPSSKIMAAELALLRHANAFESFLNEVLARWRGGPDSPPAPVDQLYRDAHDLRGLAGSFDRVYLGRSADALCRYVEAAKTADVAVEEAVLGSLKNAVAKCAEYELRDRQACSDIAEAAHAAAQFKITALQRGPSAA